MPIVGKRAFKLAIKLGKSACGRFFISVIELLARRIDQGLNIGAHMTGGKRRFNCFPAYDQTHFFPCSVRSGSLLIERAFRFRPLPDSSTADR